MGKRLLASMMTLIMLISVVFIGAFSVSASVANDACNSVVAVAIYFDCEENNCEFFLGSGTGFFVGEENVDPQYLITNEHVTNSYENLGRGERVSVTDNKGYKHIGRAQLRVYYDSNDCEEAYIVEVDSSKDVAVIKIAAPTNKRVPLRICTPTNDMKGTQIYAIGYPGIADNASMAATTKWGKDDATVTSGVFGKMFVESGTGTNVIQIDVNIAHGNSGGPVINSNGDVIGIATSSVSSQNISSNFIETETVNYAMSISEAVVLLNRNGVAYDTSEYSSNNNVTPTQASDALSIPTEAVTQNYIQNNDIIATQASNIGSDVNEDDDSSNGLVIALIVIIAVLVLGGGAGVIVFIMNKNKKEAAAAVGEAKAMAAAAVAQANTKKAYVRSLAAQHGNARIKMTSGMEIVAGRSRDCKISFTESTPGISGKHCSISYDEASRSFILKDLKSTYGTFLQDGTKLTPNTPYRLRSGDRFYLGDKANMLCVELE